MAIAPDGRIFVAQQGGALRVIKNGTLLATPFLTVPVNASGERGLLGVAFDPDFETNRFIYIYYTTQGAPIHNRVSRFTANGDVAVAGSEAPILDLEPLGATNHNGGAIHFGTDGKLYVAVGDNAVGSNAQTLNNRLGKLLRLNRDGTIPDDNPFGAATGANRAIWAMGLRNPFTFSVQPITGRLFVNDVGQGAWEEINDAVAGGNYGWPATEGPTTDPRFNAPLFAYDRRFTGDCAVTGGAFYNPVTLQFPPAYEGAYFFADFCGGWIRRLDPDEVTVTNFATGISAPVDLQVADDGSLYYLARGGANGGGLYRVTYTSQTPANLIVSALNAPKGAGSGATLQVTDRTANAGSGAAAASTTALWLSQDQILGGDTPLAAHAVAALPPGASKRTTISLTLPVIAPGTYYLLAEADADHKVGESHEGDNVRARRLTVGPDLQTAISLQPTAPTSSAPTTVTVATTNTGFGSAAASITRLYRSSDGILDAGDTVLREWVLPGLAAKATSVNSVSLVLPAGKCFLIAAADDGQAVAEVSESQNVKRVKLVVP